MTGVVVSDKNKDTLTVSVTRYVQHPKYKKYIRRAKKFHAHDTSNEFKIGDTVTIRESRPHSRLKRFEVVSGTKKVEEASE